MNDPIRVVPYDAAWPARFRIEGQLIRIALSDLDPSIEHIGSTSVPGLAAKPIIDIVVGVRSLEAFERHYDRLTAYGYEYIPEYERVLPDRRFFKRVVRGVRTHHVHVVEVDGLYWRRYLRFRDHLRADGFLASRYAELKRRLAARFRFDRDAYTNGKSSFVEAVIALPAAPRRSVALRPQFAFAA
ncbi:MAG TPA: GrpB family protein [Burkholderiaceae bacterium]|nr:GrpB family protein [Burkholderiaceae bacterium]